MAETPGQEPEQRLPVPRPPVEPAPVERFTSPPQARAFELTPERAAQVVRQTSNARWVGFLVVVVVALFVAVYWFYELGPLGISKPRLDAEADAQQVTAVERGYNLFEANCARCHGTQGEGGVGPALNRQDKLFAHLNANYLRTVYGKYPGMGAITRFVPRRPPLRRVRSHGAKSSAVELTEPAGPMLTTFRNWVRTTSSPRISYGTAKSAVF